MAASLVAPAAGASADTARDAAPIEQRLLVGGVRDVPGLQRAAGLAAARRLTDQVWVVDVAAGRDRGAVARDLVGRGLVGYAEPDRVLTASALPADPLLAHQWGLHDDDDVDIDAPEAWTVTQGSTDVTVAVVDTGVDLGHPDLLDRAWTNPGEVAGNGLDDDGNGLVDDVHGWDFVHDDGTVYDEANGDEHGTHVAGTIAASANGTGVVGVAPRVKVLPLKFLGAGGEGSTSDAISAVRYASWAGATVLNASWGGPDHSRALRDTLRDSGMVVLAAAGNESADNDATPTYPANYALDNVLSVTAVAADGSVPAFANTGATTVDLGAPGVGIVSTSPGGRYAYSTGTSMATPHVSGVAALLASVAPDATPAELAVWLTTTVEPLASLAGATVTAGVVDADGALAAATGSATVQEPVTDTVEEPVTAPIADPVTEPVTDPVTAPITEPVTEPVLEPVPATTDRLAGDGRYETAATVVADAFPDGARTVYVATGAGYADALAGGAAAGRAGAPVVPVAQDHVPAVIGQLLGRLAPSRIVVLGGEAAVSPDVAAQLASLTGAEVRRLSGPDRYATASAISRASFPADTGTVVLATGEAFADALVGTALAAHRSAPVLLTPRDRLPEVVGTELRRLAPQRVVVLGGPDAVADAVLAEVVAATGATVQRVSGPSRYATAAAAAALFPSPSAVVYVATGAGFADALAAGPAVAVHDGPLLLAPTSGAVPTDVLLALARLAPQRLVLVGGTSALGDDVAAALCAAAGTCG